MMNASQQGSPGNDATPQKSNLKSPPGGNLDGKPPARTTPRNHSLASTFLYEQTLEEFKTASQQKIDNANQQAQDDDSLATMVYEEESVSTQTYAEFLKKQSTASLHVVTPPIHDADL
jgi:hypothetical protein